MPLDTSLIMDATIRRISTDEAMPDLASQPPWPTPKASDSPRTWIVVPARKGSRGVENKNVKLLGTTTPLRMAIQCAGVLGGKVVVTTDYHHTDDPIFVTRPAHLATDTASMWAVLSDLYTTQHWRDDDIIVLLQPTSLHKDRAGIAKMMLKEGHLPSCTVDRYPDRWHPWYAQVPNYPHPSPKCRQDLPPRFRPNGLVYLMSGATARKESFWYDKPKFYELDPGSVINVDTEADWQEAERVYG